MRPVRMVDLSGLGDAADVPYEFAAWERLFGDADPTISRAVPRLELLDSDANLLPSRYVKTPTEANADELADITGRLQRTSTRASAGGCRDSRLRRPGPGPPTSPSASWSGSAR